MIQEAFIEKPQDDTYFFISVLVFGCFGYGLKYFSLLARMWRFVTEYIAGVVHIIADPKHRTLIEGLVYALLVAALCEGLARLSKIRAKKRDWQAILMKTDDSIFCGLTAAGDEVHLKPSQRAMHTQIVGTTNAGKTESVILPWAIQDIQQRRGLLIVDGKADRGILDKLYAYCVKSGREDDFRLFSLSSVGESNQFNPLIGGTPEEITERVFNSFDIENPYYRSIQFEVLVQTLRVFESLRILPTFERLHQAISEPACMIERSTGLASSRLKEWLVQFAALSPRDRLERTSGLLSALGQFAFGRHAELFNCERPDLNIAEGLESGKIMYFQLPVLLSPFLGSATGKLVLQTLQAAVANRHRRRNSDGKFFSVFLDDFTEYLYPGFVSILNKSRSAKVGIVFAHQALGDIEGLGDGVSNSILTNSNIKVFMRGSDPETAEYFSRVIGTQTTTKTTERTKRVFIGQRATGDQSARDVEQFIIHPNRFKSGLGVGEAFMVLPHKSGSRTEFVKLQMFDDLPQLPLPEPGKVIAPALVRITSVKPEADTQIEVLT